MNVKVTLYTVPVASTSFTSEAHFDGSGTDPAIRIAYVENGRHHEGGIEFKGVAAVRLRAERCCTVWHIEKTYDTLVEVKNSAWVEEIHAEIQAEWRGHWQIHHYMI